MQKTENPFLFAVVDHVSQVAPATVVAIEHSCHHYTSRAGFAWTLSREQVDVNENAKFQEDDTTEPTSFLSREILLLESTL